MKNINDDNDNFDNNSKNRLKWGESRGENIDRKSNGGIQQILKNFQRHNIEIYYEICIFAEKGNVGIKRV